MHILSGNYPHIQTSEAQISKPLYQTLKIGDILKAQVIDQLQKNLKLLLTDGREFQAQINKNLDLHIGQEVKLEVKEIRGQQVLMEINVEAQENKNILNQLDVMSTPESEKAVKILMQKMLPITKENIRQVEFGLKTSQLPVSTLLSMLENDMPMTKNTLTQMEAYENGEIKLQGQLEVMIKEVLLETNSDQLQTIHTILSQAKEKNNLYITGEETGQVEQSIPEAKEEVDQLKSLKTNQIKILDQPKNLEMIKKEILEFAQDLFFIKPEHIKNNTDTKLRNTNRLYQVIYELVDTLEKFQEDKGPAIHKDKNIFSDIKSNIEFLNLASKYDTMLHIPMIIQNQSKHGELYIFNQKKNLKKSYHEASMLISLDTVSLGTVGVYIKKYNKQISCQFKTDDQPIENIIKDHMSLLKTNLKDKGYDLVAVTYIPRSQAFDVQEEASDQVYDKLYRFDTKV